MRAREVALIGLKSDALRPFSLAERANSTPPMIHKAGAAGRPSSMPSLRLEYRARCDRGEANTSIGAVAQATRTAEPIGRAAFFTFRNVYSRLSQQRTQGDDFATNKLLGRESSYDGADGPQWRKRGLA
jgi:hypothetical protein